MSRLDAASSGVVLLARTSKAAARLTEQFRTRAVEKTYWAIVAGAVQPAAGELVDWVRKNEAKGRMEIVEANQPGAKEARLSYRRVRRVGRWLARGNRLAQRPQASDSRAIRRARLAGVGRTEVWSRAALCRGHRLARAAVGRRASGAKRARSSLSRRCRRPGCELGIDE